MAHTSHHIKQQLVRPAERLELLMRAWVVNPNEVPKISAASLHRYV
jgi:hypothetical protein